jgi:hypothetical protein
MADSPQRAYSTIACGAKNASASAIAPTRTNVRDDSALVCRQYPLLSTWAGRLHAGKPVAAAREPIHAGSGFAGPPGIACRRESVGKYVGRRYFQAADWPIAGFRVAAGELAGGRFDPTTGHYRSDFVVFAHHQDLIRCASHLADAIWGIGEMTTGSPYRRRTT